MKVLTPIVGVNFRPPAVRELFSALPVGQVLSLEPEPDNPHDPEAVRVMLQAWLAPESCEDLVMAAADHAENITGEPLDDWFHIGYVPRSGAKTDTLKCGTREVLGIINTRHDWNATLTFSPSGVALVEITYG